MYRPSHMYYVTIVVFVCPHVRTYVRHYQQVNQERNQMIIASQKKSFTNAEPLRVPNVEAYPEYLQPVHLAKKLLPIH